MRCEIESLCKLLTRLYIEFYRYIVIFDLPPSKFYNICLEEARKLEDEIDRRSG